MRRAEVSRGALVAAFAAVYLIWGSTYLAIRVAVTTIPPFLMAGSRFLLAGALLYAWARWRGGPAPARGHWRAALLVGGLLLLGGNGLVSWSEQRLDSGLTALLVATVPLWMALMVALGPDGSRPSRRVWAGLGLGFAGIALLVAPLGAADPGGVDPLAALVVLVATVSWAAGSVYARHAGLPASPQLATALEMLAGGALLLAVGVALGEPARLDLAAVSVASWAALAYLTVFGSLLAFSAYVWLLGAAGPARASTYAYVNPVVAVVLGVVLLAEPLSPRMLVAAPVILGAVMLILRARPTPAASPERPGAAAPVAQPPEDRPVSPCPECSRSTP